VIALERFTASQKNKKGSDAMHESRVVLKRLRRIKTAADAPKLFSTGTVEWPTLQATRHLHCAGMRMIA